MNRSLVQACLLVVLGTLLITNTAAHRNTRQAGRCSAGQQCIPLTSCPELLALLNSPTPTGIRRLQSLTCAFDRRNPKVCCDAAGSVTPTTTSTTTPDPDIPGDLKSNILPEQCGAIGQRVFGGDELPVRSYMWMALIGFGRRSDPNWGCGGSLISKRYVITAAHCNDKFLNGGHNIVRIRLGEHDLSKQLDCQRTNIGQECAPPVQDFSPERIIMHPTWNKRTTYSDDIALIRLDRPAQFHSYVQPICLPSSTLDVSSFLKGREAEVAGWGSTEIQRRSNVKLMVKLPFVPLESCKRVNHLPLLEKGQLCFGGVKGKDSCSGDSGGPLVSTDSDANSSNLYVLLGVVSYGPLALICGIEDRPAVYTEVSQYRNWIVSQLQP